MASLITSISAVSTNAITSRVGTNTAEAGTVARATSTTLVPSDDDGCGRGSSSSHNISNKSNGSSSRGRATGDQSNSAGRGGTMNRLSTSSSRGSVDADGSCLESVEALLNSRVDSKDHSLTAVSSSSLLAVPPAGLSRCDSIIPGGSRNNGVVGVRLEARVESIGRLLIAG